MIGSNPGTLLFLAQAIRGGSSLAAASNQSSALRSQGSFEKAAAMRNAGYADERAQDALQRGDEAAREHLRRTFQLQGAQRAALAGQGVAVDAGSAAELQAETAQMGIKDAETIRKNAYREAWGHQVEGVNYRTRGKLAQIGNRGAARQTLLAGGMGLAKDLAFGAYLYGQHRQTPGAPEPAGPMSHVDKVDLNRMKRRNPFYDPRGEAGYA